MATYEQVWNGALLHKPFEFQWLGDGGGNIYYAKKTVAGPEILAIVRADGTTDFYTD